MNRATRLRVERTTAIGVTGDTNLSVMNKRLRSLAEAPAITVDDPEYPGEWDANVSFPIAPLGTFMGGLDCERVYQ